METKIKSINEDTIIFENGYKLESFHDSNCCENHWLDFSDIEDEDWKDLKFDLSNDNYFTRIPEYGIQLNSTNNFPLRIPGYGNNNGYYSSNLILTLTTNDGMRKYDITDCQVIND